MGDGGPGPQYPRLLPSIVLGHEDVLDMATAWYRAWRCKVGVAELDLPDRRVRLEADHLGSSVGFLFGNPLTVGHQPQALQSGWIPVLAGHALEPVIDRVSWGSSLASHGI